MVGGGNPVNGIEPATTSGHVSTGPIHTNVPTFRARVKAKVISGSTRVKDLLEREGGAGLRPQEGGATSVGVASDDEEPGPPGGQTHTMDLEDAEVDLIAPVVPEQL